MTTKVITLIIAESAINALFELGQLAVTPGAVDLLDRTGVNLDDLILRHQCCDWGDICSDDWDANMLAVSNGERVLSAYKIGQAGDRLWIITEADRRTTIVLLPEEY